MKKIRNKVNSYALRAFKNIIYFKKNNIKVPNLFFSINFDNKSILITEEFGEINLEYLFKNNFIKKQQKRKIFIKLAKHMSDIYNMKSINHDPNLAGISIDVKDNTLTSIDYDSIKKYFYLPLFLIKSNLAKWNSLLLVHIEDKNLLNIKY